MSIERIKVGDRIKFRSLTRWSTAQVWRKVVAVNPIRVRFGGWSDFHVRADEISEHDPICEALESATVIELAKGR